MDDRERIEAMAAEGRITREEADRLLGVLDDIDQAEQQLEGVDVQVRSDPLPPQTAPPARESEPAPRPGYPGQTPAGIDPEQASAGVDPEYASASANSGQGSAGANPEGIPAVPDPVQAPAGPGREQAPPAPDRDGSASRQESRLPEGVRWLELDLLAGDLDIEVSDSATLPTATGHDGGQIELEETAAGYRLGGGQRGDNFLERLMSGFTRGEVRVVIPREWGLQLKMKAGDITIQGPLRYLAGHLLAGDLDAPEVHGIDLNVSAGDIDLGLLIDEGRHRIHAVAGDVNVRLLPGSNARVSGRVNIGDLSVPKRWTFKSKGIGASFEHTLGQGRAELALDLGTGDLDIAADEERGSAADG